VRSQVFVEPASRRLVGPRRSPRAKLRVKPLVRSTNAALSCQTFVPQSDSNRHCADLRRTRDHRGVFSGEGQLISVDGGYARPHPPWGPICDSEVRRSASMFRSDDACSPWIGSDAIRG